MGGKLKRLNPLIKETVEEAVSDANIRKFIMDILDIERGHEWQKNKGYEAALSEALWRDLD